MSKRLRWSVFGALGIWLISLGGAFANHELGPPPDAHVLENQGKATVHLNTQCPVHYIEYETSDYTAEAGRDYTSVSGRMTNPPWTFEVPILEDDVREPDEFIKVLISAGARTSSPGETAPSVGGSCGGASMNSFVVGKITIYDDDSPAEPGGGASTRESAEPKSEFDNVVRLPTGGVSEVQPKEQPVQVVETHTEAGGSEASGQRGPAKPASDFGAVRFVVTVGILALAVVALFTFSSRRNLTGPAD